MSTCTKKDEKKTAVKRERDPMPEAEKSRKDRRSDAGGDAEILHGSFVVADLPTNISAIYTRAVRRLVPQHHTHISETGVMEEADGATLTFEVTNKTVAAAMFRRLQNVKMYGRRWKVQYYPLSSVRCGRQACLVDARLVPAAPRALALRALGGIQGFLTLIGGSGKKKEDNAVTHSPDKTAATSTTTRTGAHVSNCKGKKQKDTTINSNDSDEEEGEEYDVGAGGAPFISTPIMDGNDMVESVVASFVDEGSALHARAVLSGRLIGTSGVRLFIERHR